MENRLHGGDSNIKSPEFNCDQILEYKIVYIYRSRYLFKFKSPGFNCDKIYGMKTPFLEILQKIVQISILVVGSLQL